MNLDTSRFFKGSVQTVELPKISTIKAFIIEAFYRFQVRTE